MVTRSVVTSSVNRDSRKAGLSAATEGLEALGGQPNLVLVFATTGHDQQALIGAITECVPGTPLVGCSAEGVITGEISDEGSHAVAMMMIASDDLRFLTYGCEGISGDSAATGRALAERIGHDAGADARALLVFPDGLRANCSRLLRALEAALPPNTRVAGGTASDMMTFDKTYQYHDGRVISGGVTALLISGPVRVEIAVSHGCDVIGLERTITRAKEERVYEIDGLPAWDVFKAYLDGDPKTLRSAEDVGQLAMAMCVDGASEHGDDIVRVPLQHDPPTGALTFGAEMREGARVCITRRTPQRVADCAADCARTLRQDRTDPAPFAVLQFDCAGRGRMLFGDRATEMGIGRLRTIVGEETPWLGCYTYGEIASPDGRPRYHNYTVVLCALYAEPRKETP